MAEPPNNFSLDWRGPGHGACNMTRVKWLSHVAAKQYPGNASAFADAFLKGCDQPSAWRFKDAATYFDHAWQPAQESCTTNAMFGGASKNSGVVDGSYATSHSRPPTTAKFYSTPDARRAAAPPRPSGDLLPGAEVVQAVAGK